MMILNEVKYGKYTTILNNIYDFVELSFCQNKKKTKFITFYFILMSVTVQYSIVV